MIRTLVGGMLGAGSSIVGALALGSVTGACLLSGFTLGGWCAGIILAPLD